MKYNPNLPTSESLALAGYGQSAGPRRREIYSRKTLRTVGAMTLQEINQWLAFGAPLDERGVALDLPRTAEGGPCMPPGQQLVWYGHVYAEEAS